MGELIIERNELGDRIERLYKRLEVANDRETIVKTRVEIEELEEDMLVLNEYIKGRNA